MKPFLIPLCATLLCVPLSGCAQFASGEKMPEATPAHTEAIVQKQNYDKSINYLDAMILQAGLGNLGEVSRLNDLRNEKIEGENLDFLPLSTEDFISHYKEFAGFSLNQDYISLMTEACILGDVTAGKTYEAERNLKIDTLDLDVTKIQFEDLFLLSKIITAEAGSNWLPVEWKMSVGEVLLNRVASSEFPNSVEECVYQRGQYYSRSNSYFSALLPYRDCVEAAILLLNGERVLKDPSVVYQANSPKTGSVHTTLHDDVLGYTYFCHSRHPELYI